MPVLLSAMAVLLAAVNAGANPPSWAVVRPLGSPGPVDYSPDRSGPLRQLNREFVTQNLGPGIPLLFNAASRPEPARPVLNTVAPANLVSTPPLRCVNGHQTEDPLSPPCVASFSGDNGGAT